MSRLKKPCQLVSWIVWTALAMLTLSLGAAEWADEITEGQLTFRSEFPLKDVQGLLDDVAQLQADLEKTLDLECADRDIQIHLFRTRWAYQRYLAVRVPEGAKRQAFYMPSPEAGRIYAYRHRGLDTDVRHETTHALLRNALPYVPLWLDEGLAEYFEVEPRLRSKGSGHLAELKLAIRLGWRPDLKHLEAQRGFLELGAREYRDSWGIVHYLIHGPAPAQQAFRDYLHQIAEGEVPGPLSSFLRQAVPDYEREIVQHLKGQ